jgi:hypothetical protein
LISLGTPTFIAASCSLAAQLEQVICRAAGTSSLQFHALTVVTTPDFIENKPEDAGKLQT